MSGAPGTGGGGALPLLGCGQFTPGYLHKKEITGAGARRGGEA